MLLELHDDSIKNKPNCFCHIYPNPDSTILKLSRYLEISTSIMIPTYRNTIDKKIRVFELYLPKFEFTNFLKILLTKFAYCLHKIIFNIFVKKFFRSFVCLFN